MNLRARPPQLPQEASSPGAELLRILAVARRLQLKEFGEIVLLFLRELCGSLHRQAFSRTALHIAGNLRATSASTWWDEEERGE